ncbi:hypothetical protein S245_020513 [Arachis hypogaea]
MGESLTEQCRVEVEGLRVMNFFSRRRSNDGLNPGQAVETTKLEYNRGRRNFWWSGLDMPRILLKERGAFGNTDTGGAWLSSARATAGDKPEEGEDDVKSSCPLCPGRHTCYNGRDKGSRSREGELTPKTRPQFGL